MTSQLDNGAVPADKAPDCPLLTAYDHLHHATYLRLLDAEEAGADWHEVARIVLGRDPAADSDGARRCWDSHMARARWMRDTGHRQLLTIPGGKMPH
ncbi:DNA -binding domain-containing protein [Gluconacetobacter sp.]|uniref:DNA -binding domain-containing protein n=1 Tax=Gluconacetobacter sp. TaxID=1935994 RepID=UPI0039EA977A